jgi:hypothetical protein
LRVRFVGGGPAEGPPGLIAASKASAYSATRRRTSYHVSFSSPYSRKAPRTCRPFAPTSSLRAPALHLGSKASPPGPAVPLRCARAASARTTAARRSLGAADPSRRARARHPPAAPRTRAAGPPTPPRRHRPSPR